jgi:hypothetical protein
MTVWGYVALKNLAYLDRWIGIQWMEAVDFTASCVFSRRGVHSIQHSMVFLTPDDLPPVKKREKKKKRKNTLS